MRILLIVLAIALFAGCSLQPPAGTALPTAAGQTQPMPTRTLISSPAATMTLTSLPVQPQIRAIWVDAFNPGIKTPQEVDRLVEFLIGGHFNTVFVQVRKRGDAYYNRTLEPRSEELKKLPDFDPLAYLLDRAHTANPPVSVHAWLVVLPVARRSELPSDQSHIYYKAGPGVPEKDQWISRSVDGILLAENNYFLDPGHPDAARYIVDVVKNLARNYAVDGIHLDYIRYGGAAFGYNPTSLARYQALSGSIAIPSPADPAWSQWRREQVTALMRQVYLETVAINPGIAVSAATIAWGSGPASNAEWQASRTMSDVFQDWLGWMQEGILDLAVPMNYDRERDAAQKAWFDRWIDWEKDHAASRHLAVGLGAYLNDFEGTLAQARRALQPSKAGSPAQGVSLYAYSQLDMFNTSPEKFARWLVLGDGGSEPPLFPQSAPVPPMSWKSRPDTGSLKGLLMESDGKPADGKRLRLQGKVERSFTVSGTGFFGAVGLPPGEYSIYWDSTLLGKVNIEIGKVSDPGRLQAP